MYVRYLFGHLCDDGKNKDRLSFELRVLGGESKRNQPQNLARLSPKQCADWARHNFHWPLIPSSIDQSTVTYFSFLKCKDNRERIFIDLTTASLHKNRFSWVIQLKNSAYLFFFLLLKAFNSQFFFVNKTMSMSISVCVYVYVHVWICHVYFSALIFCGHRLTFNTEIGAFFW